jgi:hypothetical protein
MECNNVNVEDTDKIELIEKKSDKEIVNEIVVEENVENVEEMEIVKEIDYEKEEVDIKEIDLNKVRPNEVGKVMVVMYHSFGKVEKQFVSTSDIFRENLIKLNRLDYVLVSLDDYVNNNIDIPEGKTPVVFTFDDGHSSNFKVSSENGEVKVDSDCAVGIMDSFYNENPEFGKEATFFLNGYNPFAQKEYVEFKLNYLIDNGYDIGNHSYGHEDLSTLSAADIKETLGKNKEQIESYLDNYCVNTLALPFGIRPKDDELKKLIYSGVYNDIEYNNIAVLNVGWNPANAAISKNFDYRSINRVQAGSGEFQLNHWIDYFEANPDKKYISDGNINTITVPNSLEENIDTDKLGDKKLISYERK